MGSLATIFENRQISGYASSLITSGYLLLILRTSHRHSKVGGSWNITNRYPLVIRPSPACAPPSCQKWYPPNTALYHHHVFSYWFLILMVFFQLNCFSVLAILTISSRLEFSSIASAAKVFISSTAHGLQQIREKLLQIGTHSKMSKIVANGYSLKKVKNCCKLLKKLDHYCKLRLVGYLIVHILYLSMKGHKKKILVPWSLEGVW